MTVRIPRDSYADPDFAPPSFGPMSVRDILSDMGVPPPLATMATPALFFTPGESDPSSQNTMVIVQGVQKALGRMGYQVKKNGLMDAGTQNAIAQVAGRNWASMPWNYIYTIIRMAGAQRLRPRAQVEWKQKQGTAIGEALGDTLSPADAMIVYTLPSTSIDCVGSGSSEYCYGKTSTTMSAFRTLQGVLGVPVDGKIGPITAAKAADKARELWYQRSALRMSSAESDHLGAVYSAWVKYKRPFVVAASADKTAAIIQRYRGSAATVKTASSPVAAALTSVVPESVYSGQMLQSGFGTGVFAIAGAAVLGFLYLRSRKKGGGGGSKRRRNPRRRR